MPVNKLTDALCRKATFVDRPRKIYDGHGLYLFVVASGSKIWRQSYRLNGKAQTEVFGPYPLVSLKEAREKNAEFRKKLLDGVDPKARAPQSITFTDACSQYWAGRKDLTPKYIVKATRALEMHLGPSLGGKLVSAVTRDALLVPLKVLDAQAKYVYARKVRLWASMVLEWAREQGYCQINVANTINPKTAFGRAPVKSHASIKVSEVHALFERLALERELQSVLACRMLALTWVRTGELRLMRWNEIDDDLWRVPGPTMKMKREHLVPLSKQALELLVKLKARGRGSEFVFPSDRRIDRPMSENSVLYLLGRVGYGGVMTGHGWRTVASTWANERGYNPDAIEMALAHAAGDAVRVIYNHAAYLPQRRQMLQDFADWLDQPDAGGLKGRQAPAQNLAA